MFHRLVTAVTDFPPRPAVWVDIRRQQEASILTARGVLDNSTYRNLRDAVIKAALDEPRAVIVDVNELAVPYDPAWSVFTSARWHVSTWPDVCIVLVTEDQWVRRAIAHCGVTRYVPVHPTLSSALEAVADLAENARRRARAELPATQAALRIARDLITDWLNAWGQYELIPVAGTVATVFLENVLAHTLSEPVLIVELCRGNVTVAVEDCSRQPAVRREDSTRGADILSGLSIVSALSRVWRSTPTPSGKTVWALVGRENHL